MIFFAVLSALTLKPIIIESTATAKFASDSVIPPTPLDTIFTFALSEANSFSAATVSYTHLRAHET